MEQRQHIRPGISLHRLGPKNRVFQRRFQHADPSTAKPLHFPLPLPATMALTRFKTRSIMCIFSRWPNWHPALPQAATRKLRIAREIRHESQMQQRRHLPNCCVECESVIGLRVHSWARRDLRNVCRRHQTFSAHVSNSLVYGRFWGGEGKKEGRGAGHPTAEFGSTQRHTKNVLKQKKKHIT